MNSRLPSSILIEALPESWIEKLFDRMLLSFGKKFTDQWAGSDAQKLIDHWAEQMAGFTGEEIKRGLSKIDDEDWPPTLPQFKRMCRPPVDSVHAYYEAIAGLQARAKGDVGTWSHPAIFWAATGMTFDLMNLTYSQCKERWQGKFSAEMDKDEWEEIPPAPLLALGAPPKDWDRKAAGEQLKALGAGDALRPKTDHLLWAKRIIKREQEGDKTVTSLQIRFAREAIAA